MDGQEEIQRIFIDCENPGRIRQVLFADGVDVYASYDAGERRRRLVNGRQGGGGGGEVGLSTENMYRVGKQQDISLTSFRDVPT